MATATPVAQKPWKAEYAKSSRASCRTCSSPIAKDAFRLAKMLQSTQFDGFMAHWHHASCIFKKKKQVHDWNDVEGGDTLRWEDQQKLRKYIEGGPTKGDDEKEPEIKPAKGKGGKSSAKAKGGDEDGDGEYAIENAKSSRSTCKSCNEKIEKGQIYLDGIPFHLRIRQHCKHLPNRQPLKETVKAEASEPKAGRGKKTEIVHDAADEKPSKRQRKKDGNEVIATVAADEKVVTKKMPKETAPTVKKKDTELERKLEKQSKDLWAIKDKLRELVSTAQMRELLSVNGQDAAGSEYDLRERCADGMMFGPLEKCPLCEGFMEYQGGT